MSSTYRLWVRPIVRTGAQAKIKAQGASWCVFIQDLFSGMTVGELRSKRTGSVEWCGTGHEPAASPLSPQAIWMAGVDQHRPVSAHLLRCLVKADCPASGAIIVASSLRHREFIDTRLSGFNCNHVFRHHYSSPLSLGSKACLECI